MTDPSKDSIPELANPTIGKEITFSGYFKVLIDGRIVTVCLKEGSRFGLTATGEYCLPCSYVNGNNGDGYVILDSSGRILRVCESTRLSIDSSGVISTTIIPNSLIITQRSTSEA